MCEWNYNIDEAPKDGTEFLASNGYETFTVMYSKSNCLNDAPYFARSSNEEFWNSGSYYDYKREYMFVKKWMPLPK